MVSKLLPAGQISRGLKMGKLGLSLTGSYLGYQVQNLFGGAGKKEERRKAFQHTASRKIRAELQSLKGAVMKIGQALSMQTHLLPFEATEELANLQMRAPAMHATLARARFKSSLGKYPEEVFKEFAPEPLAAASLGQVHRAVTKDGQIVAVKIQYPAIRTAIENDFKLLRSATLPTQFSGHSPSAVIEELERGILKETDYLNEARNLEFFGHALAPLPYVSVPRPLPEYSTDRVLTMTFLEGGTVDEYLHANPSQKQRDLLGYRLVELFHYQLRKVHALHSDPHPGNYLFDKEGHVALVDFGSVSHFSARMIEIIKCFTDKVWLRGDPGIQEMCHLVCGKQAKEAPQRARRTIDLTIEFYNTIFPGGPVNFGDGKIILILTKLWKEFLKNKLVNPDLIFASRAEMGMYNLLHRIGARVDTTEILNRVTKMKGPEK